MRKPDALFIHRDRIGNTFAQTFIRAAPDLAVEVVSPNDTVYELEEKVQEFLAAGVRLVRVIKPEQRTVRIHCADGSIGWLNAAGTLSGDGVLPGFECAVAALFPPAVTPKES